MESNGTASLQTLLIGIDGACRSILNPLFEAEKLPVLQSLIEDSVAGKINSQIPVTAASTWPTIYTGSNPGKHGVFGLLEFDGYDWSVVDSRSIRSPTLWEILDDHELTSVVVNAPVTHPPPAIDGAIIPGHISPLAFDCHPSGLIDDVESRLGEYHVYPPSMNKEAPADRKIAEYRRLVASRGTTFRYLAEQFDPDFGFVHFQQTDTVVHEFPGEREKVHRVYKAVDAELGKIIEAVDPETILIVSDHGVTSYKQRFHVNEWLRNKGYVTGTAEGTGMPKWCYGETQSDNESFVDQAVQIAAHVGVTSQRVGMLLEKMRLAEMVANYVPDSVIRSGSEQVDFANSQAFVRSRVECGIRINLAGREPDGVVAADDYDHVRKNLIEELSRLEAPDGTPVFEKVVPREEVYHGPYIEKAVDIVTVPNDMKFYLTSWLADTQFEYPDGSGWDHTLSGIVAASGLAVDETASLGNAHLFDVAPTVLETFGISPHDAMDGTPLPFVSPATETGNTRDRVANISGGSDTNHQDNNNTMAEPRKTKDFTGQSQTRE